VYYPAFDALPPPAPPEPSVFHAKEVDVVTWNNYTLLVQVEWDEAKREEQSYFSTISE